MIGAGKSGGLAGPARAMILAAGLGTRLRPLTDHVPKPLIPVAGHPLIAYGLSLLRENGIEDVVVNVHHLGERVVTDLGDGSRFGVRIHYSIERTLLDTGGGIRHAGPVLDAIGRERGSERSPIVILNSDVISEVPIREVLRRHAASGALITLVLRDDPRAGDYGVFGIDAADRVRRFLGEGDPDPTLRELMFASVHVIDASVIDRMPRGRAFGTMREFYPALFRAGELFQSFPYAGGWWTADTPADLAATEADLRRHGLPSYMTGVRRPDGPA